MQLEDYFDFLDPLDIRLRGHRLGIETILWDYLEQGSTPEEIALRYPTVSLEEICATLTYYWRNREKVDSYLRSVEAEMGRLRREQELNPSAAVKRLRELADKRDEARRQETGVKP